MHGNINVVAFSDQSLNKRGPTSVIAGMWASIYCEIWGRRGLRDEAHIQLILTCCFHVSFQPCILLRITHDIMTM